jgi:hypothetical protein
VSVIYRNKTFELKQILYEQVTPAWDIMKLHFPQECLEMKNRDVQRNYGSKTQTGTFAVDTDVRSGKSNQLNVINNRVGHKEMKSTNSKGKSLKFLRTKCSKCVQYVHKKNEAKLYRCTCSVLRDSRKYRPPARKGTQCRYTLKDKSVLNCTNQYVTSKKGKENHLYFSGSCERDNGNHVINVTNGESALEVASNYSMSVDCEVDAIVKEFKIVSPISNLEGSFCESSDTTENIPSYELDCSVILEDVRTDVQRAADISSCNKDSAQFISDARGTLIPFSAHEDGPCGMFPKTEEVYGIDGTVKEFEVVSPFSNLDYYSCEISDLISNILNYDEQDCSVMLEDVRTDVQKAADISSCNKDSAHFISDARGTLIPFSAHEDGPCGMFPKAKETETFDSKELKYSCHTEGENLLEGHVDEDHAKSVIIHHSLQEASAHCTVPLPRIGQFFERSSCAVPVINWE